ncbi:MULTISPECIES: hypothetical protein [unclassified Streptomyces]|uniref:hypothetical protein n=1 Tax=unclassified Streptomyces TaxID=2593676 RepID=UPI001CBFC58A|nr:MULTISPECIES: hypothetical protein [unclassified Streptomyces]WPO73147.1 hypothetical protein R9806_22185 [Streptomyces sp. KN37]
MSERVPVKVLLLFGGQAEIVADVPPEERSEPARYPAVEIAEAVGLEPEALPGRKLTASVGVDDRLSDWRLTDQEPGLSS